MRITEGVGHNHIGDLAASIQYGHMQCDNQTSRDFFA